MWDNTFESVLATLWETLSLEKDPVSAIELRKKTGLPLPQIYVGLRKFSEAGIMTISDYSNNSWKNSKKLDAISYARAVEIGIPLIMLERTVGLTVSERKLAEKIASSGQIDEERNKRYDEKIKKRHTILRGRAASRAATTDLAKIVQDAQEALGVNTSLKNKPQNIKEEIQMEAIKALEALVNALERT